MKLVNAAALLCLVIFVVADLARVLPHTDALQARDVVFNLVLDFGALIVAAFSGWCMFLRGPASAGSQLKMLFSLVGQLAMLVATASLAPAPWLKLAEPAAADKVPEVLISFATLLVPIAIMAGLMRWSTRLEPAIPDREAAGPERPRRRKSPRVEDDEDNRYFEPIPELMGDRYHEPTKVVVKEEAPPAPDPSAALIAAIPPVRQSTCAILRVSLGATRTSGAKKAKPKPVKHEAAVVGSATCIVADRYVVTAHQILNSGQPRRPEDRFYAVVAPGNGGNLFHFPVVGFPVENPDLDLAVLEIGPCANGVEHLAPLPLTLAEVPDGSQILTLGFPSPPLHDLEIDDEGEFLSARMALRGHANCGIVAARSADARGNEIFEFSTSWHHGESGGPAIRLAPAPALFSVMTDYRPVQGPRGGVMVGPYQGRSLRPIEHKLREIGASFI